VNETIYHAEASVSPREENLTGIGSASSSEKLPTEAAAPIRERILQRLANWLDGALNSEPLPDGIASEIWNDLAVEEEEGPAAAQPTDWYSIWEAVTALTQEIKLQGRSFKQLSDSLAPVASLERRVDASIRAQAEAMSQALWLAEEARAGRTEREREIRRETEQQVRREMLMVLIEIKDRLSRGLQSLNATRKMNQANSREGWWKRLFGSRGKQRQSWLAATDALEKGYTLTLESIEESLQRFDLYEIPCEGQPFDARTMSVVDRQETGEAEEGTVLEVYRAGYEWHDELFRAAQVKVACLPNDRKETS
jgi:molecular chaperone GrpE